MKERRKPDRPWQSGEIGGGLPHQTNHPRKRGSGSTRRWKAPGIGAAGLLDGRAVKAVLAVVEGSASRRAHGSGDVGVRDRSPAPSGPKKPGWRGIALRSPTRRPPRGGGAGFIVGEWVEAEAVRRQAHPQPGPDHRKAVWRRTGEPDFGRGSTLRSVRRKLRARKSSGSRVLVSKVGCRGRREASCPRRRGESRGEPRRSGIVTKRQLSRDDGRDGGIGRKGARCPART